VNSPRVAAALRQIDLLRKGIREQWGERSPADEASTA
jgi:hypothetical protein